MDRDIRDLEWCLHANPLIDLAGDAQWPSAEWFQSLTLPSNFDFIPPNNYRLGLRFEAILQQWLEQTEQYDLIAANLPIRDEKRTLGEFDLIVDERTQTAHWELAVKFYMGVGDTTDPGRFFGPNPIDTLQTKIERLQQHQLKLSELHAAKELLAAKNIHIDTTRGFVKGRLFYPLMDWRSDHFDHPDCVHADHETGWWCDLETFISEMPDTHRYAVLPKPYWLAPIQPGDLSNSEDLDTFAEKARQTRDGTLPVVELSEDTEVSRGFIVFPRWLASL